MAGGGGGSVPPWHFSPGNFCWPTGKREGRKSLFKTTEICFGSTKMGIFYQIEHIKKAVIQYITNAVMKWLPTKKMKIMKACTGFKSRKFLATLPPGLLHQNLRALQVWSFTLHQKFNLIGATVKSWEEHFGKKIRGDFIEGLSILNGWFCCTMCTAHLPNYF